MQAGMSLQWRKHPFLRILLPLMVGIVVGDVFYCSFLGLTIAAICCFFFLFFPIRFWIAADMWFCILGMWLVSFHREKVQFSFPNKELVYEGVLVDSPQKKAKHSCFLVQLNSAVDSVQRINLHQKVLLYMPLDTLSQYLSYGDSLCWLGYLNIPRNQGNPSEFDYATYLYHKGVSASGWVNTGEWKFKGKTVATCMGQAIQCRLRLLDILKDLPFNCENREVLSALLLGYKAELTPDLRQAYSKAGVSHLLALSGLHVGLIVGVLFFLLRCLGNRLIFRSIRCIIIISFLWSYAYLTGLSPSVIRASIMMTLFVVSLLIRNHRDVLNAWAIAAFMMLLYAPYYLYDIGFQLSFVAVLSLLVVAPHLLRLWTPKYRFVRFFWQLIVASLAVQVFTFPLVVYYFSTVSLFFLVANLFALPLLTCILYLSLLLYPLLEFCHVAGLFLVQILDVLLSLLNQGVFFIAMRPYAALTHVVFTPIMLLLYYFICFLFLLRTKRKAVQALLIAFFSGTLLLYVTYSSFYPPKIGTKAIFYNVKKSPAVQFVLPNRLSYVWKIDSLLSYKRWNQVAATYCTEHRIALPKVLSSEVSSINYHRYFVHLQQYNFALWCDNYWCYKVSKHPLEIDYLYVCKGCKGHLKALQQLFSIHCVVLDASLSYFRLKAMKKECQALGLSYCDLREHGALVINISPKDKS